MYIYIYIYIYIYNYIKGVSTGVIPIKPINKDITMQNLGCKI